MLLKHTPALGIQRGPGARVGGVESRFERGQAQELQELPVLPGGLAEVAGAVDHVHLGPWEVLEHPVKLVRVLAAVAVGVMPVREALVAGIRADPLDLTGQPVILQGQRPLEALVLVATGQLVLVGGEGPLDRVAEHGDELDPGQVVPEPLHRLRVVQVVAAGLEGDRRTVVLRPAARDPGDREVRPVPLGTPVVVQVEVVDPLAERRRHHLGMGRQRAEQGGGAAALRADQDESRLHPQAGGLLAHPGVRAPPELRKRLRSRGPDARGRLTCPLRQGQPHRRRRSMPKSLSTPAISASSCSWMKATSSAGISGRSSPSGWYNSRWITVDRLSVPTRSAPSWRRTQLAPRLASTASGSHRALLAGSWARSCPVVSSCRVTPSQSVVASRKAWGPACRSSKRATCIRSCLKYCR